ncbi:type I-E CRISPR-associated endoribonuclease Cas2e [Lacticaseibacillus baoqingensis]|uniref:Type I-E CRISPR-associated endoribonuclease Cas2e n=1 Tax=Lacticaseibacillus baoqingensis TaxID=2486013 RepID=A0ABW4E7Y2_9LACO|nr:type I-E CRISPR-associated endoribonuclease Cas2e [Lacticaseibacillus baoqingensis]
MIVITLTKVPPSLRGDLTKWYQEVQTGVYVGNVSARIRDKLWDRILRDIGSGQATMVFNAQNELGYQFKTTRQDHEVIDFDGLPLLKHLSTTEAPLKPGFSNAAHYHRARMNTRQVTTAPVIEKPSAFVVLDVETTGLDATLDQMIAIGAARFVPGEAVQSFYHLIQIEQQLPAEIVSLTGITDDELAQKGVPLATVLMALKDFIQMRPIIGYHVGFDEKFITMAVRTLDQDKWANKFIDLMPVVKRVDRFLDSYQLGAVLKRYGIVNSQPHNALADAQATMRLALKLIKNGHLEIPKA